MNDTAPPTYIVTQQEAATAPLRTVGAKAATLARLAREGVRVPPFFVVSSEAFALHLRVNDIEWPVAEEAPDKPDTAGPTTRAAGLRDRIRTAPVPEAVARQVSDTYQALSAASGREQVAVRSSASDEDSASASFAGQFVSILGICGPDALLGAVKQCWASSLSDRSLRYRATLGRLPGSPATIERTHPTDSGTVGSSATSASTSRPQSPRGPGFGQGDQSSRAPDFGVVVQVQVDSHKAGVAFTVHPLEPDGDRSYIEANYGTAESVTGGLANPDGVTISRSTLEIVETRIGTKRRMTTSAPAPSAPAGATGDKGQWNPGDGSTHGSSGSAGRGGTVVVDVDEARRLSPVLTDDEARQIAEVGLRLEQLLHGPQDVEWAFDRNGLWILQSRPITTLASAGSLP